MAASTPTRTSSRPRVNWLHSVGGAQYVPTHDVRAHRLGLKHECSRVRSAREFHGRVENMRTMYRTLRDQYRNHTIIWDGDWSRYMEGTR